MALDIRKEALWNTFNHLGFGAKSGVQYPGEVVGRLRNYKKWRPVEQATMSYGHGISATLLQLARAYTVFANEGELKPISLMKLDENPIGDQVFSPDIANSMKDMLELVVQAGGTAPRANIPGYRVAGKTGTAHKLGSSCASVSVCDGGYIAYFGNTARRKIHASSEAAACVTS